MFGWIFGYDWRARRDIVSLNGELVAVRREMATSHHVVHQLEERVERQARLLRALCTLLKEHGITEEALLERVAQVGDQTENASPRTCLNCGKELRQLRNRCIYCGTECPAQSNELL